MEKPLPVLLALLAALSACERPAQPAPQPDAPPPVPAPERPPAASVTSLAGEWRVAGIDGGEVDQPVGLALTGNRDQLWWEPRCAGVARTYRIEGSRVTFGSTEAPRPAGSPAPPVCDIGLPPRLDEVVRALDDASRISRTESNGILIAGPSHSLMLFSQ